LIAVLSAEETAAFSKKTLRIYSISTNDYLVKPDFRYRYNITNVAANRRIIAVSANDVIQGIDAVTTEILFNLKCYPSTISFGTFTLSSRWIAYTGNQPIPTIKKSTPSSPNLVDVANNVASSLYYLSSYLYTSTASSNEGSHEQDTEHAGSVIIYDIIQKKKYFSFSGSQWIPVILISI